MKLSIVITVQQRRLHLCVYVGGWGERNHKRLSGGYMSHYLITRLVDLEDHGKSTAETDQDKGGDPTED